MREIKNTKSQIKAPVFIAIGLAAGIFLGATVVEKDQNEEGLMSSILKYRDIITYIDKAYVDPIDPEELTETAIQKMLEELDPHTVYIPAKEAKLSQEELKGEFEGIGIEFNIFRDTIYVVSPLSGGPSEKVGLLSGDKIVTVDGENVAGIGINNRGVIDRLRGKKGTEVVVGIKRGKSEKLVDFTIIRDKIPQFSVDVGYMVDDETGYIKVSRFAATTYDEFRVKLEELKNKGMKRLVLDLQGNPGGYMDRAVNMADEMIEGDQVIVTQEGKEPRYSAIYKAVRKGIFEEGPVIVLIDEGSASGSEIVAGALQDNDRALIVGRRSFGKGLVQSPIGLQDGSELRLTISRYYTPSGRSIQKPWKNGLKAYYSDRSERYENGEFFHADSIKFSDSLKYQTAKGRTVYGGGGIMPDIFVPLDTSESSSYFIKLVYSNTFRDFSLKYYENNRKSLEKMSLEDFKDSFVVSEQMLAELKTNAKNAEVSFDETGFNRSKELIKLRIKAQIARHVWQNEGFFPIYNQTNEIFVEALKHFDEAVSLSMATINE